MLKAVKIDAKNHILAKAAWASSFKGKHATRKYYSLLFFLFLL